MKSIVLNLQFNLKEQSVTGYIENNGKWDCITHGNNVHEVLTNMSKAYKTAKFLDFLDGVYDNKGNANDDKTYKESVLSMVESFKDSIAKWNDMFDDEYSFKPTDIKGVYKLIRTKDGESSVLLEGTLKDCYDKLCSVTDGKY